MKKLAYKWLAALLAACMAVALPAGLMEEALPEAPVGEVEPFELIEAEEGEAIEAAPVEAMFALEAEAKEAGEEKPANAAAEGADAKAVPEVDICKVNYKVASTGDVFQLVSSLGTPLAYRSDNLQIARPPKGLVTCYRVGKTRLTVTTNRGVQYNMLLIVRQNPKTPMDVKLEKPASTSVDVKKPLQLSYSLSPSTAEGTVHWTTSDAEVATVENGLVTPHKLGTATIGVVTDFGGYSDTVKLTFVDGSIPTDIDITKPASTKLDISKTLQLAYVIKPVGADADVEWTSSDEDVATVANGLVTPCKTGKVTIRATTLKGRKSDSVSLTITDATIPTDIDIVKPKSTRVALSSGGLKLSTRLRPAAAVSGVTWRTSNSSVATVSDTGLVVPRRAGSVIITATTQRGKVSDRITLMVYDDTIPTSIKLNIAKNYTIGRNRELTFGYTLYPSTARSGIHWRSSNTAVATVNKNGVVTTKAAGRVTITATCARGGARASFTVIVVDYTAPSSVAINQKSPLRLKLGATYTLTATVKGKYKNYTPRKNLTWATSQKNVVSVTNKSNGAIKALQPGRAIITVRTDNGKKDTIEVIVTR